MAEPHNRKQNKKHKQKIINIKKRQRKVTKKFLKQLSECHKKINTQIKTIDEQVKTLNKKTKKGEVILVSDESD